MSGHGADEHDLNFCFPIDLSRFETDKLKLVPFNSNISLFTSLYVKLTVLPTPTNFDWLPYGPFPTEQSLLDWYLKIIQPSDAVIWFAILVDKSGIESIRKTKASEDQAWSSSIEAAAVGDSFFAGTIGYLNANPDCSCCEVGHINIIPPFQRTLVGTHANGLLMKYALTPAKEGGLGLRRLQWCANADNKKSVGAAQRLGFKMEGILRWHRVLPEGKPGPWAEVDEKGPGRHTAFLSLCWDDWRNGDKEHVRTLMER